MVVRVVFAVAAATVALPAAAQDKLPYDIDNFFQPPGRSAEPSPVPQSDNPPRADAKPPSAQIAYDLNDMFFDRVPDHLALAYRLDGLTDYTPQYRDGRDVDPLRYEVKGLLHTNYTGLNIVEASSRAASP